MFLSMATFLVISAGPTYADEAFGLRISLGEGWSLDDQSSEEGLTYMMFHKARTQAVVIYGTSTELPASGNQSFALLDTMAAEIAGEDLYLGPLTPVFVAGVSGYERVIRSTAAADEQAVARLIALDVGPRIFILAIGAEGSATFSPEDYKAIEEFLAGISIRK